MSRKEKNRKYIKKKEDIFFRFILSDHLNNYKNRSEAIAKVLNDMRARDCLKTLRGWRDEVNITDIISTDKKNRIIIFFVIQLYSVKSAYKNPSLFEIERAAASKKKSLCI
jgi:hypothetical protein